VLAIFGSGNESSRTAPDERKWSKELVSVVTLWLNARGRRGPTSGQNGGKNKSHLRGESDIGGHRCCVRQNTECYNTSGRVLAALRKRAVRDRTSCWGVGQQVRELGRPFQQGGDRRKPPRA